jgi:hypothetical protein
MTAQDRLVKLAQDCYEQFKSYAKLGDFLGVSRQQAHRICNGRSEPTGTQVVKMQDLLRKAACVLVAFGLAGAVPDDTQAATGHVAKEWSGREDLNLRHLRPERSILTSYAESG